MLINWEWCLRHRAVSKTTIVKSKRSPRPELAKIEPRQGLKGV